MGSGKNWYGLGVVLLILSLVDTAFLNYENHTAYGILVGIWGAICFMLGMRAELKGKRPDPPVGRWAEPTLHC